MYSSKSPHFVFYFGSTESAVEPDEKDQLVVTYCDNYFEDHWLKQEGGEIAIAVVDDFDGYSHHDV